jgi:hypothetical protein
LSRYSWKGFELDRTKNFPSNEIVLFWKKDGHYIIHVEVGCHKDNETSMATNDQVSMELPAKTVNLWIIDMQM